jgi:hypothetical protein
VIGVPRAARRGVTRGPRSVLPSGSRRRPRAAASLPARATPPGGSRARGCGRPSCGARAAPVAGRRQSAWGPRFGIASALVAWSPLPHAADGLRGGWRQANNRRDLGQPACVDQSRLCAPGSPCGAGGVVPGEQIGHRIHCIDARVVRLFAPHGSAPTLCRPADRRRVTSAPPRTRPSHTAAASKLHLTDAGAPGSAAPARAKAWAIAGRPTTPACLPRWRVAMDNPWLPTAQQSRHRRSQRQPGSAPPGASLGGARARAASPTATLPQTRRSKAARGPRVTHNLCCAFNPIQTGRRRSLWPREEAGKAAGSAVSVSSPSLARVEPGWWAPAGGGSGARCTKGGACVVPKRVGQTGEAAGHRVGECKDRRDLAEAEGGATRGPRRERRRGRCSGAAPPGRRRKRRAGGR